MGQSCCIRRTRSGQEETIISIQGNKYSAIPNKPKWELNYIASRQETLDDLNELDIGTQKSKRKEVRFKQKLNNSTFMIGVMEQKKMMLEQMRMNKDNVQFLLDQKNLKLIKSDRESRRQDYVARIHNSKDSSQRQNSYSSQNNSLDLTNSPLQRSLRALHTYEVSSFRNDIKSMRSLHSKQSLSQQQQKQHPGILKYKSKKKSKSMYGKRSVRFQF